MARFSDKSFGNQKAKKAKSLDTKDLAALQAFAKSKKVDAKTKRSNTFWDFLDTISRPSRAIAGLADTEGGDNPLQSALKNLTGEKKSSWAKNLKRGGMGEGSKIFGDFTTTDAVGTGLDMVLDPLNLIGVGVASKAVKIGKGAGSVALNSSGRNLLKTATTNAVKATEAAPIARAMKGNVAGQLADNAFFDSLRRESLRKMITKNPQKYGHLVDKGGIKATIPFTGRGKSIVPGSVFGQVGEAAKAVPVIGAAAKGIDRVGSEIGNQFKVGKRLRDVGGEALADEVDVMATRLSNAKDVGTRIENTFRNVLKANMPESYKTGFKGQLRDEGLKRFADDIANAVEDKTFREALLKENPNLDKVIREYQKLTSQVAKNEGELRAAVNGAGLLEDYVPHLFKESDDVVASALTRIGIKPKGFFLNHRVTDKTMRQIAEEAKKRGITLTPLNSYEGLAARYEASERALAKLGMRKSAERIGVVDDVADLAKGVKQDARANLRSAFKENKAAFRARTKAENLATGLSENRGRQVMQQFSDENRGLNQAFDASASAGKAENTLERMKLADTLEQGRGAAASLKNEALQKEVTRLMSKGFARSREGKALLKSLGLKKLTQADAMAIASDKLAKPGNLTQGMKALGLDNLLEEGVYGGTKNRPAFQQATGEEGVLKEAINQLGVKPPSEKQLAQAGVRAQTKTNELGQAVDVATNRVNQGRLGMVGDNPANSGRMNQLRKGEDALQEKFADNVTSARTNIESVNARIDYTKRLMQASENITKDFKVDDAFKRVEDAKAEGWIESKAFGMEGILLPPAQAKEFDRLMESMARKQGDLGKYMDKAMGFWKGAITQPFPAFHIRNKIGNLFNGAYLGGVKPNELGQYFADYKLMGKAKPGATFKIGHQTFTAEQLQQLGILNSGQAAKEFAGFNRDFGKFAPVRNLSAVGNWFENQDRFALFANRIRNGDSVDEAVKHVNKFLFNYSNQTATVKNMGRLIPFFTWTANNIPLQLEQLARQPGKYANLGIAFQNTVSDEQLENLPEYARDGFALQFMQREDGQGNTIASVFRNIGIPMEDLARLNRGSFGETFEREVMGSVAPPLKFLMENATGRDFYRGQDMEDLATTYGNRAKNLPKEIKDMLDYREETYTAADGTERTISYVDPKKWRFYESLPTSRASGVIFGSQKPANTQQAISDAAIRAIMPGGVSEYNLSIEAEKRQREELKALQDALVQLGILKKYETVYQPKTDAEKAQAEADKTKGKSFTERQAAEKKKRERERQKAKEQTASR